MDLCVHIFTQECLRIVVVSLSRRFSCLGVEHLPCSQPDANAICRHLHGMGGDFVAYFLKIIRYISAFMMHAAFSTRTLVLRLACEVVGQSIVSSDDDKAVHHIC